MLLCCPGWVTVIFVQWFCAAWWKFGMLDLSGTADPLIAAAVRKKKKKRTKKNHLRDRKLQMSFGGGDAKCSHAWI